MEIWPVYAVQCSKMQVHGLLKETQYCTFSLWLVYWWSSPWKGWCLQESWGLSYIRSMLVCSHWQNLCQIKKACRHVPPQIPHSSQVWILKVADFCINHISDLSLEYILVYKESYHQHIGLQWPCQKLLSQHHPHIREHGSVSLCRDGQKTKWRLQCKY